MAQQCEDVVAYTATKHDIEKCLDGKGQGILNDKISKKLSEFCKLLDEDSNLVNDLKELASDTSKSIGVPENVVSCVSTGEDLLDALQRYGVISHFHTSVIPWMLREVDAPKKLMEDWKSIEANRPQDVSLFSMPHIPEKANSMIRIEIELLFEGARQCIFDFQQIFIDTLGGRFPSELICFVGARRLSDSTIMLIIHMPKTRRRLKRIPETLYEEFLKVPSWISKLRVTGIHISGKPVIAFREKKEGEASVDLTQQHQAKGTEVVHATIQKIRDAEIFPDDKGILRRIAHVETNDGEDAYADGKGGGAFGASKDQFESTKAADLGDYHKQIDERFGIVWVEKEYEDLDQPLTSGLATRLYIAQLGEDIPDESEPEQQASFYAHHISNNQNKAEATETFKKRVKNIVKLEDFSVSEMDLAIVMDGSSSIGKEDFEKAKDFVCALIDSPSLTIGQETVRIGVIQYSSSPNVEFYLNAHSTRESAKTAVRNIRYINEGTATGKAIQQMTSQMFNACNGARQGSTPRIGIIMTDGQSADSVVGPADNARSQNITLITIGIGHGINKSELDQIANKPSSEYSLSASGGFNKVENILQRLVATASTSTFEGKPNQAIQGTLKPKKKTRLSFDNPGSGRVTVSLKTSAGSVAVYINNKKNPSSSVHMWKLEASKASSFAQLVINLSYVSAEKIYATVENKINSGESKFTFEMETADFVRSKPRI